MRLYVGVCRCACGQLVRIRWIVNERVTGGLTGWDMSFKVLLSGEALAAIRTPNHGDTTSASTATMTARKQATPTC